MNVQIGIDTCTFVKSGVSSEQEVLAEIACFCNHFNSDPNAEDYTISRINLSSYYTRVRMGLFGNLFQYTLPDDLVAKGKEPDSKNCQMRFTAQGQAISKLPLIRRFEFIKDMIDRGWRSTRLDIYADVIFETSEVVHAYYLKFVKPYQDYKTNNLTIKNCRTVRSLDVISSGEYTQQITVLGSRKSNSELRTYNKDLETKGCYKAIRNEFRFYDQKAEYLGKLLSSISSDLFVQTLSGVISGSIAFGDENSQIASFWQDILNKIDSASISIPSPRPQPTLRKTLQWFKRQVAPSLAYLYKMVGEQVFDLIISKLLRIGIPRLNQQKLMEVEYYAYISRTLTAQQFLQELGIVLPSSPPNKKRHLEPVRVPSFY